VENIDLVVMNEHNVSWNNHNGIWNVGAASPLPLACFLIVYVHLRIPIA